MEKPLLHALPSTPFELASWEYEHKVGFDCHVIFKTNRYSVPFQYIGKLVNIKYTSQIVEFNYNIERIASHSRIPDYVKYKYSTDSSHMPDNLTKTEWNTERIESWGAKVGPKYSEVVRRILASVKIKEQTFNSALAVLRLSNKYSPMHLENACEYALFNFSVPRYHHLNAIMQNKQDTTQNEMNQDSKDTGSLGYVRGVSYYGGKK